MKLQFFKQLLIKKLKNPVLLVVIAYFIFFITEQIIKASYICNTITYSAPCWLQNNYYILLIVLRIGFFIAMGIIIIFRVWRVLVQKNCKII